MISFKNIGIVVFVGLIISNMITYKSCTNYQEKYESEQDLNTTLMARYDSVLNQPPDTVKLPPQIIKGKDSIIYVTKWTEPSKSTKIYNDSIINDSIDLRVEVAAVDLSWIKYNYRPIFKYQETIVEKKIPYPVEVVKEVVIPSSGLFVNAGVGYADDFAGKVGLMLLTKKQSTYSYDFVRYGNRNMHFVSYGIKF